jgi:Mg-chelatase subunit ChlD
MSAPNAYLCPISYEVMTDPVIVPETGQTYERAELEKWFGLGRHWDPMTNVPVNPGGIKPNYAIKTAIEEWKEAGCPAMSGAVVAAGVPSVVAERAMRFQARRAGKDALILEALESQPLETALIMGIDKSGSMAEPSVRGGSSEGSQFSRMDLVKHCLRIVKAVSEKRNAALGIVSFSNNSEVNLQIQPMKGGGCDRADKAIEGLRPGGGTNMWAGLRACLDQAELYAEKHPCANIHVMFLTDGEPTEGLLPINGIPASLKKRLGALKGRVTLSCFGFGYNLESKLMESIATEGGGTFGFISDGRMAGTNIINYCATALATAVAHVEIEGVGRIGNLQVGVPRTVFLPAGAATLGDSISIKYGATGKGEAKVDVADGMDDDADNAKVLRRLQEEVAKASRSKVLLENDWSGLQAMLDWIGDHDGGFRSAVMTDIQNGAEDKGQLLKAVSSEAWFRDWGLNHLIAYGRGLACQQCLNFKDVALQTYAGPLFKEIQAEGNDLFDTLPAPTPSLGAYGYYGGGGGGGPLLSTVSLSGFNTAAGGCFAGNCLVEMAGQGERKYVSQLRAGDIVRGGHRILCVVRTELPMRPKMVRLPGLDITEWHPIRLLEGGWRFPCELGEAKETPINAYYNLVLESGHTVRIGNYEVCTLGHGFTDTYVIRHPYFGTQAVVDDLRRLPGWNDGLVQLTPGGIRRSPETGLIMSVVGEAEV